MSLTSSPGAAPDPGASLETVATPSAGGLSLTTWRVGLDTGDHASVRQIEVVCRCLTFGLDAVLQRRVDEEPLHFVSPQEPQEE